MAYKYMARSWRDRESSGHRELMKERGVLWRKDEAISRIEKPTRIDRARRLGYKDKPGYVVVRVRVRKSGFRKIRPKMGRRQKRIGVVKFKLSKSQRLIAEERTARKYPNLEVLNSYQVWKDGRFNWFETILVDKTLLPALNLGKGRGRVFRGLTSAGRKMRNLI